MAQGWYEAARQNNAEWKAENKRRAKAWRKANAARIIEYRREKYAMDAVA